MEFTLKQVADILQGIVEGNPDDKVWTLSKIEEGSKGSVSFLANPQYTPHLYTTNATAVIVANDFNPEKDFKCSLIRVADPYKAFAMLLEAYDRFKNDKKGIEQPSFVANNVVLPNDVYVGAFAYIGSGAKIGSNVKIYPHAFIGNDVIIGTNSVIHSGVKIYAGMIIGNNCIIHAGTVVGSDGFGFAPSSDGRYQKVPQLGTVINEENVEIGANTTIDRATIGSTVIRNGVKLDNLIQVAHNVEVGENTVIAAQTGLSGSTKVGKGVMIGGQVGTAGHLSIADGVKVAGRSGITKSISQANSTVTGYPATDNNTALRAQVYMKNLPNLEKRVKELEILVAQLSQKG
jgi:UDP-3-O-[3-hydroxymyristoyl] glucosamine N-acyltransferase